MKHINSQKFHLLIQLLLNCPNFQVMIKTDSTKCLNRIPENQRENVFDFFL